MDYKITVPTQAQISITLNHKEAVAVLKIIGCTSISQRVELGMTEEDAQLLSDIFFTISLEDKLKIGYC